MSTSQEIKEASEKFTKLLDDLADIYLKALTAGATERDAFEASCNAFALAFQVPRLQAANLTRIVIALVGMKVGETLYPPEGMKIIVGRALNMSPEQVAAL